VLTEIVKTLKALTAGVQLQALAAHVALKEAWAAWLEMVAEVPEDIYFSLARELRHRGQFMEDASALQSILSMVHAAEAVIQKERAAALKAIPVP
jgi:phage tail tape-measure protein